MTLDLSSPESIAAWFRVWPERHSPQLKAWARLAQHFRPQIVAAVKLIQNKERTEG